VSNRLAGKVCIITGAGGSMGREAALTFAREGALVVGCDLRAERRDCGATAQCECAGRAGANDSDWQPAKDAARQIAFAEDGAIFDGYAAAGIGGIRQGTSNPIMTLPADVRQYPEAIAQALSQLRLVGVNGPYSVLLGADAYTALAETSDHG
jgi:NAD(P)-dependent dehydrogenase (short-subunit alcohol dehydrogenase family)